MGLFSKLFGGGGGNARRGRMATSATAIESLDMDIMMAQAVQALRSHSVSKDEVFAVAVLRGLLAGFVTGMKNPELRQQLAAHTMNTQRDCSMMQDESEAIADEVGADIAAGEIPINDDTLGLLIKYICTNSSLHHLNNLFRPMPDEATRLAIAVGINVSFILWRDHSEFAERLCRDQMPR